MSPFRLCLAGLAATAITLTSHASEPAAPLSALARMPVKEITVFKDGNAFVLHEGAMPVDANGNVEMDYLPTPILGTFWPYSLDARGKLVAVSAKKRRVLVNQTALTIHDLLTANPGAQIGVRETDGPGYGAEIIGAPVRTSDELESTGPPNSGEILPQEGSVLLLKTTEGTSAVPFDRIKEVTFKDAYKTTLADEEFRNLLTLKLNWTGVPPKTANVGMVYVQKGIRWIPAYKVDLDGKGNAQIRFQATLVNELTDLDDATANLVIGVASFAFKDTPDPISLQDTFAQLGQYFDRNGRDSYALSNSIMTQVSGSMLAYDESKVNAPAPENPEVSGSENNEDLFVFNLKHVTMRKGERLAVPVSEYSLKYKDVYTLDVPFAPPQEIRANISNEQQAEIARLLAAPKVQHKIRFTNQKLQPLTTAPALITDGGRVLAQGMMTYTAPGAETELGITTAVDITAKKSDKETGRTPNAVNWQGNSYGKVDLAGTITVTNRKKTAVDVDVKRNVLGNVGTADHDGKAEMVNLLEDTDYAGTTPSWWGSYNWPYWWNHFNGVGRITWKIHLEPGQSVDLSYTWNYYWQ